LVVFMAQPEIDAIARRIAIHFVFIVTPLC
jgi:hypothetical protein